MRSDRVSVVIVARDSARVLDATVTRLAAELAAGDELIVVDNDSGDGSADLVLAGFPCARIIRNDRNRGFGAACMQGARAAAGDWLVLLNPDALVDPGSIAELRRTLEAHPGAGFATARLRSADGEFQASCRAFPTRANLGASRGSVFSRWRRTAAPYTLPDAPHVTRVPAVACAYVMIRRELFLEVGGFDARFFMFMEDTDLSLRLDRAGHPNLFVPSAGAVHDWGKGSRAGQMRRSLHHHLSMWKYFAKHEPGAFSRLLLPVLLAGNFMARVLLPRRAR